MRYFFKDNLVVFAVVLIPETIKASVARGCYKECYDKKEELNEKVHAFILHPKCYGIIKIV
ncbi:MAG: hypothetical protein A2Y21_04270 [Clostridiales bacterium GWC2_40_7]|nr:MAG: hypothetical protein A2Y21_04270 [Clostridiales bacterium GWC2_40_7]